MIAMTSGEFDVERSISQKAVDGVNERGDVQLRGLAKRRISYEGTQSA